MNDVADLSTSEAFKSSTAAKPERNGEDDLPPPRVVSPSSFVGQSPPPRAWIVRNWLPSGVATGLYGDGGLGKSLLAQQLQTSAGVNLPWLGLPVEKCVSLGAYCEDD